MSNKVAAIILAAGRGERAGGTGPKQYQVLCHETIIYRTVEKFVTYSKFEQIVVVIHKDDVNLAQNALKKFQDHIVLVEGGATRQISTLAGLEFLSACMPEFVYIHDAARPFVTHKIFDDIYQNLKLNRGILIGMPISDTLKRVDQDHKIIETVDRNGLFAAQTPQTFPFALIFEAHKIAQSNKLNNFTDDSAIAEAYGISMQVLAGSIDNIKITWPEDFIRAEYILANENNKNMEK